MNPILKNVLAVIAGMVVGSLVNFGLILLGDIIISSPEGVNASDMESLKANIHLFGAKDFIFPFLAHALGTFVGALVTIKLAVSHHFKLALGLGTCFLLGGIAMAVSLPAPLWFEALDLLVAYLPMSWLAGKILKKDHFA